MAITKNLLFLMASLLCSTPIIAQVTSTYQVGPQPDGSAVVPTNQIVTPAGTQINFNGRPLAIAIRPDQKTAAILNTGAGSSTITTAPLVIVDLLTNTIKQQFTPPTNAKASYDGVLYSADGNHLYFSQDNGTVTILSVAADGSYQVAFKRAVTIE